MSKAHDHIPAPYQVTIQGRDPVYVDPSDLQKRGIRLDKIRDSQFVLHIDGKTIPLVIEAQDRKNIRISAKNRVYEALIRDHRDQLLAEWGLDEANSTGESVKAGTPLLVLEAMKMENEIKSTFDAVIKSIRVKPGDPVQKSQLLIEFGLETA